MIPGLTEAWGAAYLQVLIVLLTFAFGIPSIILHVTLPEEIQHIFQRYMKRYLLFHSSMVMLILIFSLSFIWCLHPVSINPSDLPPTKRLLGTLFMTCALAIIPISLWINFTTFRRDAVVNYLGNRIYKRFEKDGSLLVDESTDLITLGERSEAGYEKVVVLDALDKIIGEMRNSKMYSGSNLVLILREFDKIVTGKGKPGNEGDFNLAVDILGKITDKLSKNENSTYGDEILVYQSLHEIGKRAAELRFSKVTLRIVETFSYNPRALFEIGLSAFKAGDYFTATTALRKLENLALETPSDEGHCANYFLGLLAHFWRENRGSKRKAETFLEDIKAKFSPLTKYLDKAIESHYASIHYDTADNLMTMKDEIMKISGQ